MSITIDDVYRALDNCDFTTDATLTEIKNDPSVLYFTVSPFWLQSTKLVLLKRDNPKRAYVVFRGTESYGIGTWFLINFQAASTHFYVLDPSLTNSNGTPELPVQGTAAKAVAPGVVHQGFLRSWSQLWYGTDILDTTFLRSADSPWAILKRYGLILFTSSGLTSLTDTSHTVSILVGLLAVFVTMALESGSLERLFWKRTLVHGKPMTENIDTLAGYEEVWFVGHSLGGAMATLAFSTYRNLCLAQKKPDVAWLITFGSPLVGDDQFVIDFEAHHSGRFLHIADKGDPVTYAPPVALPELIQIGPSLISPSGLFITALSLFWTYVYPFLWQRQGNYANWRGSRGIWRLGDAYNWISVICRHPRKSYRERISQYQCEYFTLGNQKD